MFSSIIARASTLDIISSGLDGTKNGVLQVVSYSSVCFLVFGSKVGTYEDNISRCMLSFKWFHLWFLCVKLSFFGSARSMPRVSGLWLMFLSILTRKIQVLMPFQTAGGFLLAALFKICKMVVVR